MKLLTRLIIVTYLASLSFHACSWGSKGHDIVACIAERHLTDKARREVAAILGGKSMMYYASWMDNIRGDKQYGSNDAWHYANVNEGATYETMPKNPQGDVYTAVNFIVGQLKGGWLDKETEATYLKYLIHLIGDMHCPMHVGRLSDNGGNRIPVKCLGIPTNLHAFWDDYLIDNVRKWSYTEWVDNIDTLTTKQEKEVCEGTTLDWLNESVKVCEWCYAETPPNVNFDYYIMNRFYNTLENQLLRGGYRLAYILNDIFK